MFRYSSTLFLLAVAVLLGESVAFAQQASSFGELRMLVKAGDVVSVQGTDGTLTRGEIVRLTDSVLNITAESGSREYQLDSVFRVTQKRGDSLSNGAWIGLIGGGLFGTAVGVFSCHMAGGCWESIPISIAFFGAAGTGASVGVDALIKHERTVFEARPGSARLLKVRPLLSGKARGVMVQVSF
jgi:hypothetical protein